VQHNDRDTTVGRLAGRAAASGQGTGWTTGIAWYGRILRWRMTSDIRPERVGLAVRRDWPQAGHDFVAFGIDAGDTVRWIARDAGYWRPGPIRPSYSLVQMSARDFYLHARHRLACHAPDCPRPAASAAAWGSGR